MTFFQLKRLITDTQVEKNILQSLKKSQLYRLYSVVNRKEKIEKMEK